MKVEKVKQFAPIIVTLEKVDEAQELLGLLQKVENLPISFEELRVLLEKELGVPMLGLYSGKLERNSSAN